MNLTNLFKPLSWFEKATGIKSKELPKTLDGSVATRQWVAERLFYQSSVQKSDILDVNKTKTELIAAIEFLIKQGYHICATAIRSDHHNDGNGNGYHASGAAIDFWPYTDSSASTWIDASTQTFRAFLKSCAQAPFRMQVGLGGSAWSDANVAATGLSLSDFSVFPDDGQDHVHLGVKFE